VGDYWVTGDAKRWYDGLTWSPVETKPSRRLIGLVIGLELIVCTGTLADLVPTAWQFNCQFGSFAESHACGTMGDYWMNWLAAAAIAAGVNVSLIILAGILIGRRRRPTTTPAALLARFRPDFPPFLLTGLVLTDVVTLLFALFGLFALLGYLGLGGSSTTPDPLTVAWIAVLLVTFPLTLVATIGVARRSSWARVATIMAGATLSLTCLGIVVGIPILASAARAPLRAPG